MTNKLTFLERFRGCMVGGVVGDCLGSPVECQFWDGIPMGEVRQIFLNYQKDGHDQIQYTDDTAMARQVAGSIVQQKTVDPKHMAKCFVHEYFTEPNRGYGQAVSAVFKKLKSQGCDEPFGPAAEQFDGSGSYGNGAAMRVHPVGLFCADKSISQLIEEVGKSAKITHSHPDAIQGAILQAACVSMAAQGLSGDDIINKLIAISEDFAEPQLNSKKKQKLVSYTSLLSVVKKAIEENNFDVDSLRDSLGNDVAALNSVPAAIFSFLAGVNPEGLESTSSGFERTLHLALAFGGDSDTICSMAGASAGAYHGESSIPAYMLKISEGVSDAQDLADKLHALVIKK